jgi:hypothetical protein
VPDYRRIPATVWAGRVRSEALCQLLKA